MMSSSLQYLGKSREELIQKQQSLQINTSMAKYAQDRSLLSSSVQTINGTPNNNLNQLGTTNRTAGFHNKVVSEFTTAE